MIPLKLLFHHKRSETDATRCSSYGSFWMDKKWDSTRTHNTSPRTYYHIFVHPGDKDGFPLLFPSTFIGAVKCTGAPSATLYITHLKPFLVGKGRYERNVFESTCMMKYKASALGRIGTRSVK